MGDFEKSARQDVRKKNSYRNTVSPATEHELLNACES